MTINATWLLTTDLVSELNCKSPTHGMPIYTNNSFWSDLKKTHLIDWYPDVYGTWYQAVCDKDEFANDPLTKIAEQISRWHAEQRQKLILEAMKDYFT